MSAPNLSLQLEPSEAGAVVYLPLAPKTLSDAPNGQLALVVFIENNEAGPVRVTQLIVSFTGPPDIAASVISLTMQISSIPAGGTAVAFFEQSDIIILPRPAPAEISVEIYCENYSDPARITMPLQPHQNPLDWRYIFPGSLRDLSRGEYWQGLSAAHASGFGGQLFAYDLAVVGFDSTTNQWTGTRPGTDGTQNEHSRTWGVPVVAMKDGTVVGFVNDMPTNPRPGVDLWSPGDPPEGDSFWIQHGTEVALYAHLQPESMNPDLLAIGRQVHQGEFLGKAGNSGNATSPHLHIQVMKGNQPGGDRPLPHPRPLAFRNCYVLEAAALQPPNQSLLWVPAGNRGLPNVPSLIRDPCQSLVDDVHALFDEIEAWQQALEGGEIPPLPRTPEKIARVEAFIASLRVNLSRKVQALKKCRALNRY